MTDDTLRDRLETAMCHALCNDADYLEHHPNVLRGVHAALAVITADDTIDQTDAARVAGNERDRQRNRADRAEDERDAWETQARQLTRSGWRQLDTDTDTVDRVAHAIHAVYCGCDGSLHSATYPDRSPAMARAAINALLHREADQ